MKPSGTIISNTTRIELILLTLHYIDRNLEKKNSSFHQNQLQVWKAIKKSLKHL